MKFTVVRNNGVLGYWNTKEECVTEIENHVNRNKDLEPELIIKGNDTYKGAWGEEEVPCEIQIWRYNRTLYFEQFIIIEGLL